VLYYYSTVQITLDEDQDQLIRIIGSRIKLNWSGSTLLNRDYWIKLNWSGQAQLIRIKSTWWGL